MQNKDALFESLHTEYYGMVHQVCLGFMKGEHDLASDLAQETFINAWWSLDKFKGDSSHKTWIYRITVNTCLKYIRDDKFQNKVPLDANSPLLKAEEQDHSSNYSELYRAIGQLKEFDRLVIIMVLDELEHEEIARVLGISEGNLRVKIHRIKKNLKQILENE